MSVQESFERAVINRSAPVPDRPRQTRPAPFSLRLTASERDRLLGAARGAPLGAYIKSRLFEGTPLPPSRPVRRTGLALADTKALAQLLAILGRTRLFSNLNQLAKLAHIGALPLDDETSAELLAALADVRSMRRLLMTALGLKPEGEA